MCNPLRLSALIYAIVHRKTVRQKHVLQNLLTQFQL